MRIPKLPRNSRIVKVRKCKEFGLVAFRRDLHGIHEIRSISSDSNEMWTVWKSLFLEVLNKHAPLDNIKIKGSNLPYITSEIDSRLWLDNVTSQGKKPTKLVPDISGRLFNKLNIK